MTIKERYYFQIKVHFYKSKETDDKTEMKGKKIANELIYGKVGNIRAT
jgi:hypothetical protein